MAGIRAGLALGKSDLLEQMRPFGAGMLPITGVAAATASLQVKTLVAERRKINAGVRENVFNWLEQKKFTYVPSVSNKFMLYAGKPGGEVAKAMALEKVFIGRVWPAWPNHVRVSIGTQDRDGQVQNRTVESDGLRVRAAHVSKRSQAVSNNLHCFPL